DRTLCARPARWQDPRRLCPVARVRCRSVAGRLSPNRRDTFRSAPFGAAGMTLNDRINAVAGFGFTARQARFLVTVALHSGYCLRRQYEAFAGIQYGKNVRDFLDGLVVRGLAERFKGRADRGHVYHVTSRPLYRALEQEDNRNRRRTSAAQIARKLMLLDFVLSRPDVTWYATETEKVDLFVNEFGVPDRALPRRTFDSTTS